ncbi:MAG: alkyl/aryl-sulfatase [bacterium]|nr:alkyl/aryl-sulfatase [bacterium]
MTTKRLTTLLGAALLLLIPTPPVSAEDSAATKRLKARNAEFENDIIKVTDGVYTAIGYTVSANSMIVGDDGIIIVDPGQTMSGGRRIRAEFEKITDKPVKAIIYTHSHGDHTNGGRAYVDEGAPVQVWARSNFGSERGRMARAGIGGGVRPVNTQGFDLLPEQKIGIGIAIPPERRPAGNMMRDGTQGQGPQRPRRLPSGVIQPTHKFSEARKKLEIAGVRLELVAAPGETADQLYVWLPDHKVVFAGDNFYKSWPNVYPLRGTARRSTRDWAESIDKMLKEGPNHVVGGHTRPILNDAKDVLTNYRDAIRFVYEQTIEGAAKFMTPDELVESIQLPEPLRDLDYLGDYYGSVEGTIRDVYAQNFGWFDGDPLSLHRESPRKQSERMAELAGGVDQLMEKARAAMKKDDPLGAARLARHVIRLRPDNPAPKRLMGDALAIVGERTFNAPARNYTLAYSNRLRQAAGKE